ncbi:3-beta-hydroxysteroid-Delta(8),Delta(7)-isomerase [Holothuria leucospilota]|uniref:3-beta-hydroxysteroid-Delta(8), Delta(7)-isomerase n=1 Tax=Holothuria leucospilota TaxID=206669 RepID=A0A9Q1HJL3_HOLLE|nr:3-beta-hydroxysteroid-Delta(8),Delta(7)-isomerase [Holothuria leucospilota]
MGNYKYIQSYTRIYRQVTRFHIIVQSSFQIYFAQGQDRPNHLQFKIEGIMFKEIQHPFTPQTAEVPGYVPNVIPLWQIFACYLVPLCVICLLVIFGLRHDQYGKKFGLNERVFFVWFAISGFTHICVEIPFTLGQASMAWRGDIWSEIWKEYSKADSRYILAQSTTVAIEIMTAWILGPMCLMVVWLHYKRNTTRYVLELIIAVSHLYGTTVYYLEEHLSGYEHVPVDNPKYMWLYFGVFNSPWLIFPVLIIIRNWLLLSHCQAVYDVMIAKREQLRNEKKKH